MKSMSAEISGSYKCEACGMYFATEERLREHIQRAHGK
jgi:hypothetical protein